MKIEWKLSLRIRREKDMVEKEDKPEEYGSASSTTALTTEIAPDQEMAPDTSVVRAQKVGF